jgi:two-component system chemotaxis response regulator CheB
VQAEKVSVVRDTVVIGGSAGSLKVIRHLMKRLPDSMDAAILIAVHQAASLPRHGVTSLVGASRLPSQWAEDGSELRAGTIYVAPPDRHMTLATGGDTLNVFYGPRENLSRPSINTLFRSAAAGRSARTIAVLLSGLLDDGVAGLQAVQRSGGLVVVQDPEDSDYPQMPRNAIHTLEPDAVVTMETLADVLAREIGRSVPEATPPDDVVIGARLAGPEQSSVEATAAIGRPSGVACPECGGPLWQVGEGEAAMYHCHVGHAQSTRVLMRAQDRELEKSLWIAVRTLEDRAVVLERLAREHRERGTASLARDFERRAAEAHEQAARVRDYFVAIVSPHEHEAQRDG